MAEPLITINGVELFNEQAQVARLAIEAFWHTINASVTRVLLVGG